MGGFILIDRLHQRHRRRRAAALRAAPRRQRALAGRRGRQGGPRRSTTASSRPWSGSPGCPAPGKSTIANIVEQKLHDAGAAHLPARRRQRPPRAQPRPRVHRRRPGREHPPGRRGREADGRRRAHRARVVHLAVPRRTAHGPRARSSPASSSRSSSTPPSRSPRRATARASTRKARRGELTNFTGIDSPYEAPEHAELRLDASGAVSAADSADQVVAHLRLAGILDPPPPKRP